MKNLSLVSQRHPSSRFLLSLGLAAFTLSAVHGQETALIETAPKLYTLVDAKFEQGLKGQAIRVTGDQGYAEIQGTGTMPQSQSFTLEALVKVENLTEGNMIAVRRGPANDWQLFLHKDGRILFLALGKSNVVALKAVTTNKLTADVWQHLCVSVDDKQMARIYLNGDPVFEQALAAPLNETPVPIRIGGAGISGRVLSGLIEDVRFYSGPVSTDRLTEIKKQMTPDPSTSKK